MEINLMTPEGQMVWDNDDPASAVWGVLRVGDDQEWTPEQRDIHFQITATRGYYLGSATTMPFNEHELILPPGQRYQVTDIRQISTGTMLGRRYSGSRHRLYIVLEELYD